MTSRRYYLLLFLQQINAFVGYRRYGQSANLRGSSIPTVSCKQYYLYTVVTFVKRTFVALLKYNEILETRMDFSFPRSPDASYCTFLGNFEFSSTEISTEKYRRLINI